MPLRISDKGLERKVRLAVPSHQRRFSNPPGSNPMERDGGALESPFLHSMQHIYAYFDISGWEGSHSALITPEAHPPLVGFPVQVGKPLLLRALPQHWPAGGQKNPPPKKKTGP